MSIKTIYIGVSGHRHIKRIDYAGCKEKIKLFLLEVIKNNDEKEIVILSSLSDGADRFIVQSAIDLKLEYQVILPMALELYQKDFSKVSLDELNFFMQNAKNMPISVPLCDGCTEKNIAKNGVFRNRQYLRVGQEIVERSEIMIFLWDKKVSQGVGGTADIVTYARKENKNHIIIECEREKFKGNRVDDRY